MTTCALQTGATSVYAWVQVDWATPYELHMPQQARLEPPSPTLIVIACKPADTPAHFLRGVVLFLKPVPPLGSADAQLVQRREHQFSSLKKHSLTRPYLAYFRRRA